MRLTIEHALTAAPPQAAPSTRVLELAAMFGLGVDDTRTIHIVPRCEIPLPERGGIVLVTGPSGSGKSTILRLIAQQCIERGLAVLKLDELPEALDVPLIDALGDSLERAVSLLSQAGLGDAFVMLRTPSQLSDGQRARFRIAQAMEWADRAGSAATATIASSASSSPSTGAIGLRRPTSPGIGEQSTQCVITKTQYEERADLAARLIFADEFAATLDRLTAHMLARGIRRWIDRAHHVFIAATTHDDLLEAIEPDVLVYKGLGDQVEICTR